MIRSFADRDTERLFGRDPVRRDSAEVRGAMRRKLVQVDTAERLDDLRVSPRRINEIVHGKRAVTADTALRLARYFGTSERFWLHLQAHHDVEVERDRLGPRPEAEVAVRARDELSVMCDGARVPPGVRASGGWRALRLAGPFDFTAVGVLLRVAAPLAAAGVSVMPVATFDTHYVLVRASQLEGALAALRAAGHAVRDDAPTPEPPAHA